MAAHNLRGKTARVIVPVPDVQRDSPGLLGPLFGAPLCLVGHQAQGQKKEALKTVPVVGSMNTGS